MFNKFTAFTALSLIISAPAFAEEPLVTEEVSSWTRLNEIAVKNNKLVNDDINRQINNDSKQDLKEFVRNANALKRIDNPDAEDIKVDVNNKDELRKFIKEQIGFSDNVIPEEELKITPKKTETPRDKLKRARQGLQ